MQLKDFKQYDSVYILNNFDKNIKNYPDVNKLHFDIFKNSKYIELVIDDTNLYKVNDNEEKKYFCFIPWINRFYEFSENTECFKEEPK